MTKEQGNNLLKVMLEKEFDSSHAFNKKNIFVSAWCSDSCGYDPNITLHNSREEAIDYIYGIILESYSSDLEYCYDNLEDDCTYDDFVDKIIDKVFYSEYFYYSFL